MIFSKTYSNGLKVILNNMQGAMSVSCGILVKTGSANERADNNGISHFVEHNLFKGTKKRTAFEISADIDNIGAQINAYTAKETTCYYTKSTYDHLESCLEILADIFFNSTFSEEEIEKEKGVVLEEINMTLDTPDEVCLDLLAEAYFGNEGMGRTILGTATNVKAFTRQAIIDYMQDYYTADNVCISIAGRLDVDKTYKLIEKYFVDSFSVKNSKVQYKSDKFEYKKLNKYKKIEQSHLALSMPAYSLKDEKNIPLSIANTVFGGGMSSRLFQTIREQLGLAYSVYSYRSVYKDCGVLEVYAGVNNDNREKAYKALKEEIIKIGEYGITDKEFLRGKEQAKSSFIFSQESTASQMLICGKNKLFLDEDFDFEKEIQKIDQTTLELTNKVCAEIYNLNNFALASVGPFKKVLE